MPLRFAFSPSVLHDDSHPAITILIHRSAKDPNTRMVHFHDRVHSFGGSELEHLNLIWSRNRVAVQCHDIEFVTRQSQLDGFRRARVENPKHDSLAFFKPYWITESQTPTINGERLVADFPAVGFLSVVGSDFGCHSRVFWFPTFFLLFHLTATEEGFKLVCGQKHFLIVVSGIITRLNINHCELSRVQPAI